MCLILFAWQQHPDYPLLVAANRDEYHQRAAEAAHFWPEHPQLLAGRDVQAGGTWMGINRDGDFAAVTNYREPGLTTGERSRGELPRDFLLSTKSPGEWLQELQGRGQEYGGFNILAMRNGELGWYSNQGDRPQILAPGIYGVSNGLLDDPWPKVIHGKELLATIIKQGPETEACMNLLQDRSVPKDEALPDTGVGVEFERLLGPRFILSEGYGTRASTVLRMATNGSLEYVEQSYNPAGEVTGRVNFALAI